MLKESYRILAPGGEVRIATPILLKFVQLFQGVETKDMQGYVKEKLEWHHWPQTEDPECLILNHELHGFGHQFVYTPKMLRARLEAAGFRNIKEFHVGESDDASLRNLEDRANWAERTANDYETMIFQAVRE